LTSARERDTLDEIAGEKSLVNILHALSLVVLVLIGLLIEEEFVLGRASS
jgi:hypothetical protein